MWNSSPFTAALITKAYLDSSNPTTHHAGARRRLQLDRPSTPSLNGRQRRLKKQSNYLLGPPPSPDRSVKMSVPDDLPPAFAAFGRSSSRHGAGTFRKCYQAPWHVSAECEYERGARVFSRGGVTDWNYGNRPLISQAMKLTKMGRGIGGGFGSK